MSEHKANERLVLEVGRAKAQGVHPTCVTCKHCVFTEVTSAQGMGECWYDPPVPFVVFGAKGEMLVKYGINAPVKLNAQWCHHHDAELVSIATPSEIAQVGKGGAS